MDMPTFEELFKIYNLNMWMIGITGTKVHFRFYFILMYYALIVFEEGAFFIKNTSPDNLVAIAGLVPCICYCTISLFKVQALFSNRFKILKLTECVKDLYTIILKDPIKTATVRSEIVLVQKLIKYLYILNLMLGSVYNVSTLIIIPYYYVTTNTIVFDLPYPVVLPFSTEAWIPWFFVYIHSCSCAYICISYTIALDSLYFLLVTILSVNFSLLCDDFQNLKDNNFRNINNCIRKHQFLIKLSEDLNDLFQLPNFFNVLFGAIQICLLGFCITAGELSNVPGYLIFLSTILAQIWTVSIFGENIMSRSSKVNEAISNSVWYEADTKTMKTVLFIIARSQKPQTLTAYLFSTVCIGSFRKIISNSWSYFSVLRSSYKPAVK